MKIINQCLCNYCDQQLIYTYRGIATPKLMQPIIPPYQQSHSLPVSSRFQLSMPQYVHSEEGKSHPGPAIPPCATCELVPRGCSGVGDPAQLCHTPCTAAAGKFGTLKPCPMDLPLLSMWGQTVLGKAWHHLWLWEQRGHLKSPWKMHWYWLAHLSERDATAEWGFREATQPRLSTRKQGALREKMLLKRLT